MSTQTITKKRKSTGDVVPAAKKVKTAKSADKPAPAKSALKKAKDAKVVEAKPKAGKAVKAKAGKGTKDNDGAAKAVVESPVEAKPKSSKAVKTKAAKSTKANDGAPDAVIESVIEDAAEGGAELTEDQTAALLAGFSSSEDEASGDEEEGVALEKLPQAPRIKDIQKQIKAATAADPERTPGVIYIGRLPHGFFEHQLRAYLSQFGDILHLRLARNRKTGKSQHYAFVEFASAAVAEIVAKTMDKYLLFSHILQVRTVPREQVKENMWKGSGRRKKPAPRNRLEGSKLRRGMVREDWDKKVEREARLRAEKAEKLKELGYEFEMPALKAVSEVPTKPKEIEDGAPAGENDDGVKLVQSNEDVEQPVTEVFETVRVETVQPDAKGVAAVKKTTTKKRTSSEFQVKKAKKVKT